MQILTILFVFTTFFIPEIAFAEGSGSTNLGLTGSALGILGIFVFVFAYILVMIEEFIDLRKSKPVILAAGIIWVLIAILCAQNGISEQKLHHALDHNLNEYAALFFFLLVAMTYINTMTERNVFEFLRSWLVFKQFSYRKLFWITGIIAFFLSPIADNLTTALLMGAVVMAVGANSPKFVSLSFINIVIAANAGGAFSPFGDITTLMVWQAGKADFFTFFELFLPSVVNFLVPAAIMHFYVPDKTPEASSEGIVEMKSGAITICVLFLVTIVTAVSFKQFLHLPPFMGMMTGFSYLLIFSFILRMKEKKQDAMRIFDIFQKVERVEWDTLFFFFGVIFSVGGLGFIGYLDLTSHYMYGELGASTANILAGFFSAIVDNIPVMFAILSMNPDMDSFQWMLITLTAGVGGSLLSVGSAAGVALMGQSRGMYTFMSHLKWTPVVLLGYVASICTHFLISG
ncbi:MAG: sodium:proton antiporter NhaD [Nitrospinae bacterium]|nr:sodium:proton antiporter NhaD [Nitrospinota bacterium]